MKEKHTLDKPEEKRLFGVDLHINRFHIINPDHNELLISEKKSFNLGLLWAAILFGAMGSFFLYITYNSWQEGEGFSSLWLTSLFALFPLIVSGSAIYGLTTNKVQCHFTPTELIKTNILGRKKIIPRSDVISVFVTKQITTTNGKQSSIYYSVDLRVPAKHYRNGELNLFQVEEKNNLTSVIGGINHKTLFQAEQEALQLATIIADHWNIPLKT